MKLEWKDKHPVHYLCDPHGQALAWVESVRRGWLCCAPGGFSATLPTEEEAKSVVFAICRMNGG